ncbi:MAG TPA: hypothetical protein VGA99_10660 [bacterium]
MTDERKLNAERFDLAERYKEKLGEYPSTFGLPSRAAVDAIRKALKTGKPYEPPDVPDGACI